MYNYENSIFRIEVRDLKKAAEISHTIHTIDQVRVLVHSPIGNYVASLEGRPGDKNAAVRIYCNWFNPKIEGVRPRIASRVTPSLRSDQPGLENMLDMIEFPHRYVVDSKTGKIYCFANKVMVVPGVVQIVIFLV